MQEKGKNPKMLGPNLNQAFVGPWQGVDCERPPKIKETHKIVDAMAMFFSASFI